MIKDIVVHLDGTPEDEIRLEHGYAIASAEGAHLLGFFTNPLPDLTVAMPLDGAGAAIKVLIEIEEKARQEGNTTAQRLKQKLAGLSISSDLIRLDETFGILIAKAVEQARCADLFIATRPYGESEARAWPGLVEAVLFGSGRALLIVPPNQHRKRPIETVLVAWNGSREAARALREGLSFIRQASRVVVLLVQPSSHIIPSLEVEGHLGRHGVVAEVVTVESDDRRTSDIILDEARRASADLIVMGGYGHSRLRERVFGGTTLSMLTVCDRPFLLAH